MRFPGKKGKKKDYFDDLDLKNSLIMKRFGKL